MWTAASPYPHDMFPTTAAPTRLSALQAAQDAAELARVRLFPFRLNRWLPLGFVALLDQCGRGGVGGNIPSGGGPGGGTGDGSTGGGPADELARATDWVQEHIALILGVGCAILLLVLALMALVTFLRSRGTFMYLDDVATGRADIVRPWHEHEAKAWSFFGWAFGATLAGLFGFLLLLVPVGFAVVAIIRNGASCGPIGGIVAVVLAFLAFAIALGLFGVLLRDFAAPLQMILGVRAGQALGIAWGLVKAYPGAFLAYLGLKIVFGFVAAIVALLAGCLTCCVGFLPVVSQTILQPLHYFERAWSLFLLRQAGYDIFPAAPPAPPAPPPFEPQPAPIV
jgi:hypothetical protein